jgi:hypothetical protein
MKFCQEVEYIVWSNFVIDNFAWIAIGFDLKIKTMPEVEFDLKSKEIEILICHTRFLYQNQVLFVFMTQDQLFHTYGQKCSKITKCHNKV